MRDPVRNVHQDRVQLLEVAAQYSAPTDQVVIDVRYRQGDRVLGTMWSLDWEAAHEHLLTLADAVAEGAGERG
jgi:hypothetical protein